MSSYTEEHDFERFDKRSLSAVSKKEKKYDTDIFCGIPTEIKDLAL